RNRLVHRVDGVRGLDLDVVHQLRDLLRRLAGALGETLHFFRDDREAATRVAGGGGLHGRVQRQHVRAFGDRVDEVHDAGDFLRTFAETLDALFGFGNGFADA